MQGWKTFLKEQKTKTINKMKTKNPENPENPENRKHFYNEIKNEYENKL